MVMGAIRLLLLACLVLAPAVSGLIVNPLRYEITDPEPGKSYNVVLTVINPDSQAYEVSALVAMDSAYLAEHVTMAPAQFRLEPNGRQNIQLSFTIPEQISPERHSLNLDFIGNSRALAGFEMFFTIDGTPIELLALESVHAEASQELVYFTFRLRNDGTVIARGSPVIEILKGSQPVHRFGHETSIMVMPGERYNLTMIYDTGQVEAGAYQYSAYFLHGEKSTAQMNGSFRVEKSAGTDKKRIREGESLDIEVTVDNPGQGLSFYRIEYSVPGTGLADAMEGQFQSDAKSLQVALDTHALKPGDYRIELQISTGRYLEKVEKKTILLEVGSRKSIAPLIAVVAAFAISAFFITRLPVSKRLKRPDRLRQELDMLHARFARLEQGTKEFTGEISHFVHEANDWLRMNGYGQHGFR